MIALLAGCAPAELTAAGADVAVRAAPAPGCERITEMTHSAGYNGRGAEANEAGAMAALRNDAAARGGDSIVVRRREIGAAPVDSLSQSKGAVNSGGCPNCVVIRAEVYRCGGAPSGGGFAAQAGQAFSAAAEQARACLPAGGPSPAIKATITFAPSGEVIYVEVLTEPAVPAPVRECLSGKMRGARVPPFSGAPRSIQKTAVLTPRGP